MQSINKNILTKGTMKLVDETEFKKLLFNLKIEETIAGGSVANSILGGFNMLPFGPLDGKKIKSWSEPVLWSFICIFAGLIYLTMFSAGRAMIGV